MAALEDFEDVPALKYLFIKDATSGKQAFFNFDLVMTKLQGIEYDITRLKNDVLLLKDRFDELDAALEMIDKALEAISNIRKELLDAMSALRQELRDEIARINEEQLKQNTRLDALESKANALGTAIDELKDKLALIEEDIVEILEQVEKNTADITKLNKTVVIIQEQIVIVNQEITSIKQDLLDNYAKLHEVNSFTAANTFKSTVTIEQAPVTDTDATNKRYVDEELAKAFLPAGSIIAFAGNTVPDGYLLCDGTTVAKRDYPDLYKAIGGLYGENETAFKLPDLRDRFIQGGAIPSAVTQDPSLPNIMGNFTSFGDPALSDGAFKSTVSLSERGKLEKGNIDGMLVTHFDASRYSPYYKNSAAKIVPLSYVMMYLIKV